MSEDTFSLFLQAIYELEKSRTRTVIDVCERISELLVHPASSRMTSSDDNDESIAPTPQLISSNETVEQSFTAVSPYLPPSDGIEEPLAFMSGSPEAVRIDPEWFFYPDGNVSHTVPLSEADSIESTGYGWNIRKQYGSKKSGVFKIMRRCAGALQCPNCSWVARPYIKRSAPKKHPAQYAEKTYRKYCAGICLEQGNREVGLIPITCHCELITESDGVCLTITHVGTHLHAKPPIVRATKAEYQVYVQEASDNLRITPKKKVPEGFPLILIQTPLQSARRRLGPRQQNLLKNM